MIWRMRSTLATLFGARAQGVVGVGLVAVTTFQTVWWLWVTPPTVKAVFIVSMEALYFAAYGVIVNALGYRATERVEAHVVENIENADTVEVAP